MNPGQALDLRDIHLPVAPDAWPPAPGWWLLAGLLLVMMVVVIALLWRRRRRRRALERLFDERIAAATSAPAQIAAMSELLRRAALRHHPASATLQGGDWLAFLDRDARRPAFQGEPGRLLLEGGFRRQVEDAHLDALHAAARARFLTLAQARR